MAIEFTDYDPADDLETAEAIVASIEASLEVEDAEYIAEGFAVAARAKGMAEVARKAGLPLEQIRAALREDNLASLQTALALLPALGLRLAKAAPAAKAKPAKTKKAA